jgi:hypothetical protein
MMYSWVTNSEVRMPATRFVICWTLLSITISFLGVLWASSPTLFVRFWRRIATGDYYIRSAEWEKAVVGLSGRWAGFFLVCFGLCGFYVLLKMIHLIK